MTSRSEPAMTTNTERAAFDAWQRDYMGPLASRNEIAVMWAAWQARALLTEDKGGEAVALGDEWTPCVKLPITVHVRKQRPSESHVSTREGITPVRPDDLIMRGVQGEEYPIGRELWEKTYTTDVDTQQQAEDKVEPVAVRVHAYGGITGINDYLMSDGSIKAMRPIEVVWATQPAQVAEQGTEKDLNAPQ